VRNQDTPEEKAERLAAAREFQKNNYRTPYLHADSPQVEHFGGSAMCGYTINRDAFEVMTGLRLNPKVYELPSIGQRVIVALTPQSDKYGDIVIPESTANMGNNHGWVVSVGSTCDREMPIPGNPQITHPAELLGLHWYFDLMGGRPLQLGLSDSEFDAPLRVITARDLWLADHRPWNDPWDLERTGDV